MKLWPKKAEPARRQRQVSEDLGPKPASFAYRSQRSQSPNTGRQASKLSLKIPKPRSLNFWLQRLGMIILLIAVGFSLVNVLSLSSRAKIMPLARGEPQAFMRDQAIYEEAANKILASSVWNRNKITVDTQYLSQELQNQFAELATVDVTIPLLSHRPLIYIEPAQPALILLASNGSFIVATSGKALMQADTPEALNQPELPKLNDQSGLKVELNKQAVPAKDVSFIQTVIAQLRAKQLTTESLTLPAATRQLDIKLTGQPYTIKFNLMSDKAREQVGAFLATLEQLKKQNITPAQYIDVRVNGRVYYQ